MTTHHYPIFAPEGRVHIIVAVLCGIAATWFFGYWSLIVWLMILLVLQFFRDPKRHISDQPGAVVSPASGKVVSLGETENPYLAGVRSFKVSIFMNAFSVHSNLIPIGGVIEKCWYHPGRFLNAALDKSSGENERNAIWIRTGHGEDIVSVQIAGLIARRILSYVKSGDTVATGQRYGFIRFGSRLDLYLPIGTRLLVKLGQRVRSGSDLIGFCHGDDAGTNSAPAANE